MGSERAHESDILHIASKNIPSTRYLDLSRCFPKAAKLGPTLPVDKQYVTTVFDEQESKKAEAASLKDLVDFLRAK